MKLLNDVLFYIISENSIAATFFESLILQQIAPEVHFTIQNTTIKAMVHGSCLNENGMEIIIKNEVGVWKLHLFLKITLFFA